jgi:hypothetical protein
MSFRSRSKKVTVDDLNVSLIMHANEKMLQILILSLLFKESILTKSNHVQ